MTLLLLVALASTPKEALLQRLRHLSQSEQFLFGQQQAYIWGMSLDGRRMPTAQWYEQTARAGRFTSDVAQIAGDDPAVLGITIDMLAYDPPEYKRAPIIAEAVRRHFDRGGVVTLEWHPKSCNGGGFYAEDLYVAPIRSRADVPSPLTCLCEIANEREDWLVAQAKHLANVIRSERLGGKPFIIRPFHEHNGDWFWWGQPYWNCGDRPRTGEAAFKHVMRTYIETLKKEPGLENALFAYSPGAHRPRALPNRFSDPAGLARDMLRERIVKELAALGLAHPESPAYSAGYPGDDVIDILGMDLYFPRSRNYDAATWRDADILVAEAQRRHKPHAFTEIGTYRLPVYDTELLTKATDIAAALNLLFDAEDRARLIDVFGQPAPVRNERPAPEDWFNTQLLPLARHAKVAYAVVWQTYVNAFDSSSYYYVPFAGHPEADNFKRFTEAKGVCLLHDPCDQ